ncbi:MAG: LUD domain-containing protein, partial [Pelobacteraceae bacterium]
MGMTEDLVHWSHEQKCRKAVASLEKNGFTARYCETAQAAAEYILSGAADAVTIGFGGSMSIVALGVEQILREQGKELLN